MALPSWWQVVTPHRDILKGRLSEAIFAADLGSVVQGNAPLEYQDARIFFQKTYLTSGLTNLLKNVLSRLSGEGGDPVIQLQTRFGGGKTHALLALYHVVNSRESINHVLDVSDLPSPNAKVAVFVGTHADALHGRTPWGEIARQLGQYHIVEEHDRKRVAPGKERIREVLEAAGPTLILMDELLEYIVKANRAEKVEKIMHGQTLAFLQELSEVVASLPNCCLVITLPASILERYDEEAEKSLQQLQKVIGRMEATYTPVEGMELYEVIRKRLFEDLGDDRTRREVADWYFSLYQRLGTEVPPEVREVEYRERIWRAYPFHPELIDVLYERWGSYPTFQRTRGVLRLLAEVVADLYQERVVSPLIHSSLVNMENQSVRNEFIKHIGNEYDSVISADIAGPNAKAPKIDREMGSEYEKYGIARGIATSVFLYSFSGGERRGTTLPRIRVALLREGIPTTIVGDAIAKLEQELWYMHSENKQYAFRNQPNLNRVIVDREETITYESVEEALRELIQRHCGREMEVYIWPEQPSDIPDTKSLKLAILSPAHTSHKGKELAEELFAGAGTGFRVYKNTLFVLMVDESSYLNMERAITRYLALSDIHKDKALLETLTKQSQEVLREKYSDAEKYLPTHILSAYRQLALLGQAGIEWKDLGIPTIDRQTLSDRVKQRLMADDRVLSTISPKYLLDKTFRQDENEKSLREVYEILLKTPGLSIPESEDALRSSVAKGVEVGTLGLRRGGRLYHCERITPDLDDTILRGEYAKTLKAEEAGEGGEVGGGGEGTTDITPTPPVSGGKGEVGGGGGETKRRVRRVNLRASVPWDKLSSVISGVIHPLKSEGKSLRVVIEVEAESEEGFDRTTLNAKVKETLMQVGSTIEKWEED